MSRTNPYPNIGFDPVPGTPEGVTDLRTQINSAGTAVKETNDLLKRLRNSNDDIWKGDAGDAFRTHFDNTLAQDLGYAQNSLERAVTVLDEWHTGLVGYQDTAKTLEIEAAAARADHAKAVTALQQARANPDLGLANRTFTDQNALAAAQSRLDTATAAVRSATTSVTNCQGRIDSIIKRAKDLESEHGKLARKVAAELDAAAKDFAPSAPNHHWWDSITDAVKAVGKWIDEHRKGLHEALSIISTVAGLLAVVTPPPIDAIALGVSLAAGAGALALDATDKDIRDAFLHGSWSDKLKAAETVGGDAMSMIPGVGGLAKVGKVAMLGDAVGDVGRFEGMARAWSESAHAPGWINQKLIGDGTGKLATVLNSSGLTAGTHTVLQAMKVEGAHAVPDPAVALKVLKGVKSSVTKIGSWGYDEATS